MSRIGNNPISIPEGVSVNVNNNVITVNGKNGEMSQVFDGVSFDISDNTILVKRNSESKDHKSKHGLYRSLVANMVTGVSEGFTKELEPVKIGRAHSELQSHHDLVCRLLLEKKKKKEHNKKNKKNKQTNKKTKIDVNTWTQSH